MGSSRISRDGPVNITLPAGELVDARLGVLGHLEFLENPGHDLFAVFFGGIRGQPQLGGVMQCLAHRQLRVHHIVLWHHADAVSHDGVLSVDPVTFEGHLAR
ncbi:Uncharacterised protein [Mycobacteroides abscessus subsp. massiliense]|nr:Uncharacterised protein [Mycobacteroides abscessus subsp. massiliense]